MKQTAYSTTSVARMELRGIRGLWLAAARRFREIPPDSAALHPGYAALSALARVARMELRGIRGFWLATARRFHGIPPDSAALHPGYAALSVLARVARMELRGIRDLWLAAARRFRGIPPDSAALHPGYADAHSGFHAMSRLTPRQAGAALITSLIFLTVLTILGMSTLGTALLESRMAGNARDRNLAFQAAEIGLRDAELFIRDSRRLLNELGDGGNGLYESDDDVYSAVFGQTCTYGVCAANTDWTNPFWGNNDFWANAIQYQRDTPTTAGKPVGRAGGIQLAFNDAYTLPAAGLPLVSRQPEYLIETFAKKDVDNKYYFRITVRGYGMRPGTRVMLQEVYTPN